MGLFTAFLVTSKHVKRANLGNPIRTSEETVARNISVSEENGLAPSRNSGPNSIQSKHGFHARSGLLQDSEIVNLDERNPETGAGITGEGFADAEEDDSKDCTGVVLINHGSHEVGALSEEQLLHEECSRTLLLARLASFGNGASFACHISLLPIQVTKLVDLDGEFASILLLDLHFVEILNETRHLKFHNVNVKFMNTQP